MTVTTPAAVSDDDEEEQKHDDEEIVVPPGDEGASTSSAGGRQQQHFGGEFPRPFYDPITGEIMNDPMVGPNGDSYDLVTTTKPEHNIDATTGGSITWYPNRALQTIIQREVEMAAKDWKGSLRRFDDALQTGWNRLLDQSAFANGEYRPLPEGYYCPITCDLMTDPVITPDGISYERDAVENWVIVNGTSPVTRNALSASDLRRNNNLYQLIQLEKDRTLESIHPSIRRWQESGADTSRPDVVMPIEPTAPPAPTTQAAATTTTASYPTTSQQIEARRRQQQQQDAQRRSLLCIFIFTAVVFLVYIPYGGIFIAVFFITLCCFTRNAEQRRQQQRR